MDDFWLTGGRLITPRGILEGAVQVRGGRIAAIRAKAPRASRVLSVRGAYIAPGFIDLHVWGPPSAVSVDAARHGTTAFLSAFGPEPREQLLEHLERRCSQQALPGAQCLGVHLEGPFLSQARAGALPRRWMRRPAIGELAALVRQARVRLVTFAPELPGAIPAIRWCARRRIVVSLGHSEADSVHARRAVAAGARAVTHVFNGMRPLHHRRPGLLDVALTEPRLTAMVIADGVHVSASALQVLVRAKGPAGIALVTDSVKHQQRTWRLHRQGPGGAYYTRGGILAGSGLTMLRAVQQMVESAGVPLAEAVRMASEAPARLLGEQHRGRLAVGMRADLTVFRPDFATVLTIVGGEPVFVRGR